MFVKIHNSLWEPMRRIPKVTAAVYFTQILQAFKGRLISRSGFFPMVTLGRAYSYSQVPFFFPENFNVTFRKLFKALNNLMALIITKLVMAKFCLQLKDMQLPIAT